MVQVHTSPERWGGEWRAHRRVTRIAVSTQTAGELATVSTATTAAAEGLPQAEADSAVATITAATRAALKARARVAEIHTAVLHASREKKSNAARAGAEFAFEALRAWEASIRSCCGVLALGSTGGEGNGAVPADALRAALAAMLAAGEAASSAIGGATASEELLCVATEAAARLCVALTSLQMRFERAQVRAFVQSACEPALDTRAVVNSAALTQSVPHLRTRRPRRQELHGR